MSWTRVGLTLGALVGLAGCPEGSTGTINLSLTTSPGSAVLQPVTRLRVTLTSPRQVMEADRTEAGFALDLEVDASGDPGALIVEGLDAGGTVVATGSSPPFSVAAITAGIVVFVAAPMSITEAPVRATPSRRAASASRLTYGAVIAGGTLASGEVSGDLSIYNAYDHTLLAGLPLEAPRAAPILAATAGGVVHVFGGLDATGAPTGTLVDFNTTIAPRGAYVSRGEFADLARAGETAIEVGVDSYLVTGEPAVELVRASAAARPDLGALPRAAASLITPRGEVIALFVGPRGLLRFRARALDVIDPAPRDPAVVAVVGLADGRFAIVDGATRELTFVEAETGARTVVPDAMSVARTGLRAAATSRHVVVFGTDDATADILDASSGARLTTLPITPRTGGFALPLPNDQVLLGGSETATDRLDLFTAPPPAL